MAEEAPTVQNKWLLIIALGLGLFVALIYNIHVASVREESRGETKRLLKFKHDMFAGQTIDAGDDLEVVEVPLAITRGLEGVVMLEKGEGYMQYDGQPLNRDVHRENWLLRSHITGGGDDSPSGRIPEGDGTAIALAFAPEEALGDILRPGDWVNIVAMLPDKQGTYKYRRIIEGVRVLAVGGRGERRRASAGDSAVVNPSGLRSYRTVTIGVHKDTSLKLRTVITHVSGSIGLELRNPRDSIGKSLKDVKISREVEHLAEEAAARAPVEPPES